MIARFLRPLGSPAFLRFTASVALLALIAFGLWLVLSGEAARVGLVGMATLLFSILAALRGRVDEATVRRAVHEELMEYEAEITTAVKEPSRRERRRR